MITDAIVFHSPLDFQCLIEENGVLLEGFPSGQRDQTVNLTAQPSKVRILPPPPTWYWYGLFFMHFINLIIAGVVQW